MKMKGQIYFVVITMVLAMILPSFVIAQEEQEVARANEAARVVSAGFEDVKKAILENPNDRPKIFEALDKFIDAAAMGKSAVGKKWNEQKPEAQEEFVGYFKVLCFNMYADSVTSFFTKKAKILKVKGVPGKGNVKVLLTVLCQDQQYEFEFYLNDGPQGWKVVNFNIEGINLVRNFREQFAQPLLNGSLEDLTARIKGKIENSG